MIDVATCIPISYIMMLLHGVEAASGGKQVRMLKILRLLKLAKLLRVTRAHFLLALLSRKLNGINIDTEQLHMSVALMILLWLQ